MLSVGFPFVRMPTPTGGPGRAGRSPARWSPGAAAGPFPGGMDGTVFMRSLPRFPSRRRRVWREPTARGVERDGYVVGGRVRAASPAGPAARTAAARAGDASAVAALAVGTTIRAPGHVPSAARGARG